MTDRQVVETTDGLRAWARGDYTLEAAVELLVRAFDGRFARAGQPWIMPIDEGRYAVLAGQLALAASEGPYSGGERRVLAIASSLLGAGVGFNLDYMLSGLDRHLLGLVLAAVAHAGGSHEHPVMRPHPKLDGALFPTRELAGSLYPWPEED